MSASVELTFGESEEQPAAESAVRMARLAGILAETWDLADVCERIVQADLDAVFPDYRDDQGFIAQLRSSVSENLEVMRETLTGTGPIAGVVPEQPARFAETQAQLGMPQAALHRSYRIGFLVCWRHWSELVATRSAGLGISAEDQLSLLRWSTERLLTYVDIALVCVSASYMAREEALRRTGAQARQQVVREIINATSEFSTRDVLLTLGYDLSAFHVVIQILGMPDIDIDRLTTKLRRLAWVLCVLSVRLTTSENVIFVGRSKPWSREQVAALHDALRETGVVMALSEPAVGVAGFRAGYDQVKQVESVRESWPDAPTILTYPEVRLEALLMADLNAAQQFVSQELGPLAEESETAARLRETLMTSFRLNSHVATAEHLRLHEHTVRNRLQRAEQTLGHPLTERRVEVQVALRLRRMLGEPPGYAAAKKDAGPPRESW